MGVRGLFGFLVDGELKITLSRSGGYPTGIGQQVVEFIQSCNDKATLRAKADSIEMIRKR
ncbi:hypothetical protein KIPB_002139, partial [Kipferlia bialata]|eukprot:g2139.t1